MVRAKHVHKVKSLLLTISSAILLVFPANPTNTSKEPNVPIAQSTLGVKAMAYIAVPINVTQIRLLLKMERVKNVKTVTVQTHI